MPHFDDVVNIYSPNGHLMQVDYAQVAVNKGSTVVGVRTSHCVVLGVEKRPIDSLKVERASQRIKKVAAHMAVTFTGLAADARILVSRAQDEAHSYHMNFDRLATIEYIARYLAKIKQKYTQSSTRRPFGVGCLIGGFDEDGEPHLFHTDPAGNYNEWAARAIGHTSQRVNEYFEKAYKTVELFTDSNLIVKFALRGLLLASECDPSTFDMVVLKHMQPMETVSNVAVQVFVDEIRQDLNQRPFWRRYTR